MDTAYGAAYDTEEISESRNFHGNLAAVGISFDKRAAEELGMPPKTLCYDTRAGCAGNGYGLVVPLRTFHQFHGGCCSDVLQDAAENGDSCNGAGGADLPVQTVCRRPLSLGCDLRCRDRGTDCGLRSAAYQG